MKILIVDDHPIVISGLKALLEAETGFEVVEAANGTSAEQLVASTSPDIAVVDINLPGQSGFEVARRMLERDENACIVLFSMNDDPVFVAQAIEIGAKGFVSKNDNPADMLAAIRAVAAGQTAWPPGSAERIAHLADRLGSAPTLTAREKSILRLLSRGQSLSEIADQVGVSYKTVAMNCAALRTKLHARTQTELIAIAVEKRLV